MPRSPRVVLPGFPHHVVHRGHNRRVVFQGPGDYSSYLDSLKELTPMFRVRVQAYCLMPNHVHLLLEPESIDGMARLMKRLAGRHTARINRRENLTGGLWEGRYYSSVVSRDAYWQECHRYIELNPVRAALVADPEKYRWSSCRYRTGCETAPWLDVDPWFLALGATPSERWQAYRDFLQQGVSEDRGTEIRNAVHRGQPTGVEEFERVVERTFGRLIIRRGPGRPRKK
ncbi:MAG: transposase [Gammaproteobacteria bacterium]